MNLAEIFESIRGERPIPKTDEERTAFSKVACERQCESINASEGNLNELDGFFCSHCKNKGYRHEPRLNDGMYAVVQIPCVCAKIRKNIRALNRSGLKEVVDEYKFDTFEAIEPWQKHALSLAQRYVTDGGDKWMFIGGASGRGKTHLCTAAAIEILKRGNEIKYMLWRDDVRYLKSVANDPIYGERMDFYKNVDLLYIDDLFKCGRGADMRAQRPTEADISIAFEIINNRVMQKKPTIISSESTLSEILDIDEAIGGRIRQRCGEFCLNIGRENTKNYRLRG
jgi:DNA replication protein DnaC